jgi:hypothetical protein
LHSVVVTFFGVQTFPQAPQFCVLVCESAHALVQQSSVPVHAVPHLPQFFSSEVTSAHAWLQHESTALEPPSPVPPSSDAVQSPSTLQPDVHVPSAQYSPLGHVSFVVRHSTHTCWLVSHLCAVPLVQSASVVHAGLHVCVVVLHLAPGPASAQSGSTRHATHVLVVGSHFGVLPLHVGQPPDDPSPPPAS